MSFSTGSGGTSHKVTWNFGGKTFAHTAPTGYSALQQDNLPETGKGVSGFVWMKVRDAVGSHHSNDSSNGAFNRLVPNLTNAMAFRDGSLSKFLKGGQAIGDNTAINNPNPKEPVSPRNIFFVVEKLKYKKTNNIEINDKRSNK